MVYQRWFSVHQRWFSERGRSFIFVWAKTKINPRQKSASIPRVNGRHGRGAQTGADLGGGGWIGARAMVLAPRRRVSTLVRHSHGAAARATEHHGRGTNMASKGHAAERRPHPLEAVAPGAQIAVRMRLLGLVLRALKSRPL